MKNYLTILTALLIGCSTCKHPTQPEPTPPAVDAGTATEPTAKPPVVEKIDWKTPDELWEITNKNPGLCILAYFPDAINGDTSIESTTFTNQELVKLINKTFVSMKFPMTASNAAQVMHQFNIKKQRYSNIDSSW